MLSQACVCVGGGRGMGTHGSFARLRNFVTGEYLDSTL